MKEFKRLLFPVDLSDVSPKIAPWVHSLARAFDAEVHLLFGSVADRVVKMCTAPVLTVNPYRVDDA